MVINSKSKKQTTKSDIHKKLMIEALRKSLGVVTPACEAVGIARSTHYEWLDVDPEYKKAVDEMADIALDFVESKLFKSINDGSDTASIFYLKYKGKKRNYVANIQTELSGTVGISNEDEKRELKEQLSRMSKKDFEAYKKSKLAAQEILKKYEQKKDI